VCDLTNVPDCVHAPGGMSDDALAGLPDTFTGNDCTNDPLPGFADHIGNDVRQLDVHLGERLLHVLRTAGLASEQYLALARQTAQLTHRFAGAERTLQQAVGVQLLQPLALKYVTLSAGHVLDVPGVDEEALRSHAPPAARRGRSSTRRLIPSPPFRLRRP